MVRSHNRLLAAAVFTGLLVVLVNLSWWYNHDRTKRLLEDQLNRRLAAIVEITASSISPEKTDSLLNGNVEAYIDIASFIEEIRQADSLSEIFILDENHMYLATTLVEPDSVYFLSVLNGVYIDSLFFGLNVATIVPPAYQTGDLRLKSAFAPLFDSNSVMTAVLGIEADVDYYESLEELRNIFFLSTGLSIVGGLILGFLFMLIQRRLNKVEQNLFLSQTHAYLGRMVAVVAHELKNPLMIMRASGERLNRKQESDEARYIVEEVDRLNEIVSGYLDFARAEGSFLTTEQKTNFQVAELVISLRKHIVEKYDPLKVDWISPVIPAETMMSGYQRSLRQILLNLLINGADSCKISSKPIKVGISFEEYGDSIKIIVTDNGAGIRASEMASLFDPFHTTKQDGSGLGLYLCKKIVEEMGGTIKIVSEPNHKTDVEISLPAGKRI